MPTETAPSPLPAANAEEATEETCDAVVIGGGPSGVVAAMRLAEAGWHVVLVERSAFPRRKVCGEYLSATNWRLLRRLGVWDAFRHAAGPEIQRVALFARRDSPPIAPLPRAAADPTDTHREGAEAWGRALSRDRLDLLLLDEAKARGARVLQPARCTSVERERGVWRCDVDVDGGEAVQLRTPIVVAAHGAWARSSLPTLPPSPPATDRDLLGFKAHFEGAELPVDLMPLLAFPGGYGGMVTCQGGVVSLSCCVRRRTLAAARDRTGLPAGDAVLEHIRRATPAVARTLDPATRKGEWLSAGPIRPGRRRLYRDGVFAVGNAGGECHSVVAEGISMAMQSGWLAADALLGVADSRPLGEASQLTHAGSEYKRTWDREFGGRLRAASLISAWAMSAPMIAASAPVVRVFPSLLTLGARLAGKSRITCLKSNETPDAAEAPQ
ncbi:MAG: FAD-dependent oxidoreductase [Planctomycetota bacterium]